MSSYLPNSLIDLTFGNNFNQKIDKLPNNLTSLFIWSPDPFTVFDQSIDKLPETVKELAFVSTCRFKNNIPEHIENLRIIFFPNAIYDNTIDNIPHNIKKIIIDDKIHIHYLKKIPFGCVVVDMNDQEIML